MPEIIDVSRLTICRRNRTFGSCLFFAVLPESYMYLTDNSQLLYFKIPYLYSCAHACAHKHLLHSRVVPRRGFDRKDHIHV